MLGPSTVHFGGYFTGQWFVELFSLEGHRHSASDYLDEACDLPTDGRLYQVGLMQHRPVVDWPVYARKRPTPR